MKSHDLFRASGIMAVGTILSRITGLSAGYSLLQY